MSSEEIPQQHDQGDDGRNSIFRIAQTAVSPLITAVTEISTVLYYLSQGHSLGDATYRAATLSADAITEAGSMLAIEGARAMTDRSQALFMGRLLNLTGSALDFVDGTRARSNGMLIHLYRLANRLRREKLDLPESFGSPWGGCVDVVHDRITEFAICEVAADAVGDEQFSDLMTGVGLSCVFSTLTKARGLMQGISTPEEGYANMRQGTMRFRRMAMNNLCAMARGYREGRIHIQELTDAAEQIYTSNLYTGRQRIAPVNQHGAKFDIIGTAPALKEARKYTAVTIAMSELTGMTPNGFINWLSQHGKEFYSLPHLEEIFDIYPEAIDVAEYFTAFMRGEM